MAQEQDRQAATVLLPRPEEEAHRWPDGSDQEHAVPALTMAARGKRTARRRMGFGMIRRAVLTACLGRNWGGPRRRSRRPANHRGAGFHGPHKRRVHLTARDEVDPAGPGGHRHPRGRPAAPDTGSLAQLTSAAAAAALRGAACLTPGPDMPADATIMNLPRRLGQQQAGPAAGPAGDTITYKRDNKDKWGGAGPGKHTARRRTGRFGTIRRAVPPPA